MEVYEAKFADDEDSAKKLKEVRQITEDLEKK